MKEKKKLHFFGPECRRDWEEGKSVSRSPHHVDLHETTKELFHGSFAVCLADIRMVAKSLVFFFGSKAMTKQSEEVERVWN